MPDSIEAINDLTDRGFGEAEFLIDADGNPIHVETIFTVKLDGLDPREFFARAKADGTWQPGDRVRVPRHGGKYDVIKIVRPAKKAA